MTEKEKAKAYDEALKKASIAYKDEDRHLKATLERIFPELKESEDEKIRKEIISILRNAYWTSNKNRFNELVAWLEKQGENSTDKTKQIFKVGDWVVDITDKSIYQVEKKENCQYILRHHILGDLILYLPFSLEGLIREWTIQDAKDGDVIQLGTVTAIFKKYIGGEKCICYCSFCKDGGFEIPMKDGEDNVYGCYNATPATKEQRDTLMKLMNDAGYKWDAENKELKKHKR